MHNFILRDIKFPAFRGDRNKHVGGKMVFIRNGITAKRPQS